MLKKGSKGENIFSKITLDQLVTAIATLGDRSEKLENETWRWNSQSHISDSLWREVIEQLNLDHNEKIRHCLYKLWHLNRHNIRSRVNRQKKINNGEEVDDDHSINTKEEITTLEVTSSVLSTDSSLPQREHPNTRTNQKINAESGDIKTSSFQEKSFVLTGVEWKSVFSRTTQRMKDGWTDIFYNKLTTCGVSCPLKFRKLYIKKGLRKEICSFLTCRAECAVKSCSIVCRIYLHEPPLEKSTVLFLVRVFGEQNHNPDAQKYARQLRGDCRLLLGKRVNEIGPLAAFRERVKAANENLLTVGNYTGCETIETLKKAASDYRKTMRISENIYQECRIAASVYHKENRKQLIVPGYVQTMCELPFTLHLYSQSQIEQYIAYCSKEKYSYVHIDATGGVLKAMHEQSQLLLYAIVFKDVSKSTDTAVLAHAILAKQTVPSISNFFENLGYSIIEINKTIILPTFFVIDFSAAIMNAILRGFLEENINTHLKRCWNVIHGKYNSKQLRSSSFIHFCCCHVIHAIARSLTAANIDKKIRQSVLYIFAFVLCCNDIKQAYDILGSVVKIFGNENEDDAEGKLDRLLSFQLNVDEETKSMLTDDEKIFEEADNNDDELKLVDEYLRTNTPIIHQSPFNQEAIRRYPMLTTTVHEKSKDIKATNKLFSPSIIRVFYRWWAYLPLWTGLLWNFKERYSESDEKQVSMIYSPVRHSNALIESYFRTLKRSVFQQKRYNRPLDIIVELRENVKVQSKANEYDVSQSSKGRKRRKQAVNVEEKWGKRQFDKKRRTMYFNTIDKAAAKQARKTTNEAKTNTHGKIRHDSEEKITNSSPSESESLSNVHDGVSSNEEYSIPSSPKSNSIASNEYVADVGKNTNNQMIDVDDRSELSAEFDIDKKSICSIENGFDLVDNEQNATIGISLIKHYVQHLPDQEVTIDNSILRWPRFEVKNVIFEGHSYSLSFTCPLDSALFALYFIYRTDNNIAGEINNAPPTSPYSILVKTFDLVEKEGWDIARIGWLLEFNIIKKSDNRTINLFGSVDERVFTFVKSQQRHSSKITCTRPECKEKERNYSSTELRILYSNSRIEKFEEETVGICRMKFKFAEEMNKDEAEKNGYKLGSIPIIDYETNKNKYIQAWICDAVNIHSTATFDYGFPPIVIVDIEPLTNTNKEDEGYEAHVVRIRDVKRILKIGTARYQLRAVIHNKNEHFTTTIVAQDDNYYIFDDLQGVRRSRTSGDPVNVGIYSRLNDP